MFEENENLAKLGARLGLDPVDSLQINDITCYGSNDGSAS